MTSCKKSTNKKNHSSCFFASYFLIVTCYNFNFNIRACIARTNSSACTYTCLKLQAWCNGGASSFHYKQYESNM